MQVRKAVDEYLLAKSFLRFKTLRWCRQRLERFAAWCEKQGLELEQVKAPIVRRFLQELETRSQYTLHSYAQVVKGFLSFCSLEEGLEGKVTEKTVRLIELPRIQRGLITIFTPDEIRALFDACDKANDPVLRARDKAVLSLLLDCGLRISEIAYDSARPNETTGLRMENVFLRPGDSYLKIVGKGGKERRMPLGNESRLALKRYITRYRGGVVSSFVFLSRRGGPLVIRSLEDTIKRLAEWAGVKEAHAHKFRHSYACLYLLSGGDIFRLSRLMGHSRVEVTQIYTQAIQDMQLWDGLSVLDKFNEAGRRDNLI